MVNLLCKKRSKTKGNGYWIFFEQKNRFRIGFKSVINSVKNPVTRHANIRPVIRFSKYPIRLENKPVLQKPV